METAVTLHQGVPPAITAWDPFQLMDRLDEEALRRELEGIACTELVYVVKDGGQEVVGLSKVGVDECCMTLVHQGQVIREEDLSYEMLGEGQAAEALFKCRAARYAVSPTGVEVKLDQVLGVKRQPLYYDAVALSLDTRAPGKKYKGLTYRELLERADGRDYLAWMADNFSDDAIREFVKRILAGEDATAEGGRKLNPHWYEHGCMKAARNARYRLIPGNVRAQIIATARQAGAASGLTRTITQDGPQAPAPVARAPRAPAPASPPAATSPTANGASAGASLQAPTEKQVAFYRRLAESPVFTADERTRALAWLTTQATKQTIKDQIDWLKRQVETRQQARVQAPAAAAPPREEPPLPEEPGDDDDLPF